MAIVQKEWLQARDEFVQAQQKRAEELEQGRDGVWRVNGKQAEQPVPTPS